MMLQDMRIAIAGRLRRCNQDQLTRTFLKLGAYAEYQMTPETSLLVVGSRPGKRAQQAQELGIPVLSEADVWSGLDTLNSAQKAELDPEERLAILRELLHQPPSQWLWRVLCEHFRCWPQDDTLLVALDYTNQHLDVWPVHLRIATEPTITEAARGLPMSPMILVRHLSIESQALYFPPYQSDEEPRTTSPLLRDKGLCAMIATDALQSIETMDLPSQQLGDKALLAMLQSQMLPHLRALRLEDNLYTDAIVLPLLDSPLLRQLDTLYLQSPGLSPLGIRTLRSAPQLRHIKDLQITESLKGTGWHGGDSDGEAYEFHFCPDGHLKYKNTDTNDNYFDSEKDQWRQVGPSLVISMTNSYAMYRGTLKEKTLTGSSINITQRRWTWELEPLKEHTELDGLKEHEDLLALFKETTQHKTRTMRNTKAR